MSSYWLMFPAFRSSLVFSGFGFKPPASGFQSYSYSSLKPSPPPFKDNGLPLWVPDVLCQPSEVVLWNLLSVQMFFWWICGGESGLPVLFFHHLPLSSSFHFKFIYFLIEGLLLYIILLFSVKPQSAIRIHISLPFDPSSHLPPYPTPVGWYRAPVWVSWAMQQIPVDYVFHIW